MAILCILIYAFIAALIIRIILDWVQVPASHPVGQARSALASVTDPVLEPMRRVIPPIRMGAVALDVSVIVLIIGLQIVSGFIC